MAKRVGGFFTKMGGQGGPKCKIATHPLPPDAEQRWRPRGVGGGQSGRSGLGGGRGPGKEGEGVVGNRSPASPRARVARRGGLWGTDPLPRLELGWRAEAARRERAAAVGGSCGGGAREAREGAGGGGRSCEAMATSRTSLYSRGMAVARRWRGGPCRWRSNGFGGALMALDRLLVSRRGMWRWRGHRGRRRARGGGARAVLAACAGTQAASLCRAARRGAWPTCTCVDV